MEKLQLEEYYKGNDIHAYTIFGAHLCEENHTRGTRFTTYAPHALGIQVIGSFNQWSCVGYQMERVSEEGVYSLFIAGATVGDMYKYRVTQAGGRVVDKMDPYAFYSELRPNTASIITNLEDMLWSDASWIQKRNKHYDKPMNIYEMHLGSWKKEENEEWVNYRSVADELIPYLKAHFFTHVELMPLNEYPFDGSWGYQCSGYFSATSRYGKPEDLMYLINALHMANIGVIMDFVPVHFVRDDFSLAYFDGTALYEYEKEVDADSQWGTANFNLWKEEVRSFLMSAASFWIDKYHIDGLRMDAISNVIHWHGNKDLGENEGAIHFIKRMNYNLSKAYPGVMLIAEDSSDFPKVSASTLEGGLGFDYKWDLGWMNDTLHYLEMDPIYRKWHHTNITFSMAYFYSEKFIVEFSHDEVVHGKKTIVDKMWGSYEEKFSQLRTLYLYMFTHPGKKLNFMGNELAHFREWDETRQCDWNLLSYPTHDAFQKYFARLGELYTTLPALYEKDYDSASFEWIDADNADENLFSYMRKNEHKCYVVILNFSANPYQGHPFGVPLKGVYKQIVNTELEMYGGDVLSLRKHKAIPVACNHRAYRIEVDVPAFGGILLEHTIRKKTQK